MNEYKFYLSLNGGTESEVHPIWGDGLSVVFGKESNQEFFRRTLNSPIVFVGSEFSTIASANIETEFVVRIERAGETYWTGVFHKTDCTLDYDAKTASVTPSVKDDYNKILSALDKEYNFDNLNIARERMKYDIRPKAQIYIQGADVITELIGNVGYEKSVNETGLSVQQLIQDEHFTPVKQIIDINIDDYPPVLHPELVQRFFPVISYELDTSQEGIVYTGTCGRVNSIGRMCEFYLELDHAYIELYTAEWRPYFNYFKFNVMYDGSIVQTIETEYNNEQTLKITDIASGDITYIARNGKVFLSRVIVGSTSIQGHTVYPLSSTLTTEIQYKGAISYVINQFDFGTDLTTSITKYGLYDSTQYYNSLPSILGDFFPIMRSQWERFSIWYPYGGVSSAIDMMFRVQNEIDGYLLWGVIKSLLDASSVSLTFDGTEQSSEFLFGTNRPILAADLCFMLYRKRDFVDRSSKMDNEEVEKLSLKNIFEFLRDAFRAYWFVDNGRLRIEHIQYFINGGSYSTPASPGIDLTEIMSKTGKNWSFGQNVVKYDKVMMPERYEFGWADNVTELFTGLPLNIVSGFVEKGRVESVNIQKITTDIDYILSNPTEIAKSGFIAFGAILSNNEYKVAYYNYEYAPHEYIVLQNGYLAFIYLYKMYLYDLPAQKYRIGDGAQQNAYGVRKGMTQEISFPSPDDPNTDELIRTQIGDGKIEKLTVNLSSRAASATIKLPTQ